jgi:ubiquinone/menaquinone biosynthesis C-methylase UbiE
MGWKELKSVLKRLFGRGVCPYQAAFLLTSRLRRLVLAPEKLVARLELRDSAQVLELGPGPGYFSPHVARRLPQGYLLLLDVQREMLAKARRTLAQAGVGNVGYAQGDGSALPVRDAAFDVAFLVAVLGEVRDPGACLREIYRALRAGGLLSITELPGDPDHMRLSEVRALAEPAGFRFEKTYGRGRNYTANFRK